MTHASMNSTAPLPPSHLTPEQIAWLTENGIPLTGGFARLWGLYRGRIGFAPGEDENSPLTEDWDRS